MKKLIKLMFATLLISTFLWIPNANAATTADLYLSPTQGNYKVGDKINLTISVNPNSNNYDTVLVNLKFPADLLQFDNFAFGSQFTIQSPDNTFSNSAGTFSYSAGIPGGINTSFIFGTVGFIVKKAGTASVVLNSDSQILNSGDNIFSGQTQSTNFVLAEVTPQKSKITQNNKVVKPVVDNSKSVISQNQTPETATVLPQAVPIAQNLTAGLEKSTNNSEMYFNIIKWVLPLLLVIIIGAYLFFRKNNAATQKKDFTE